MNWIAESRKQLDLAAALRAAMEELEPSDWRAIHDLQNEANEAQREADRLYHQAFASDLLQPRGHIDEHNALREHQRTAGHPI